MTNIEKVKELVGCPQDVSINDWNGEEYNKLGFEYAMEMAKWKDEQFKEYLEGKIEPYIRTNASPQGTYQEGFDDGYTSAINEIINELFEEKKI